VKRQEARILSLNATAEEMAATLGLKTSWPGLYPSFTDAAGHSVSWNWGE